MNRVHEFGTKDVYLDRLLDDNFSVNGLYAENDSVFNLFFERIICVYG